MCTSNECFVIQKCYVEERLDLFCAVQQADLRQMDEVERYKRKIMNRDRKWIQNEVNTNRNYYTPLYN